MKDVKNAYKDVKSFLKEMSKDILSHSSANEIIECHLNPHTAEARKKNLIKKLQQITQLK
ncbi:MAG: hypothetical protein ACOCWK_05015 [Tangfeifania sp.]